MCKIICKKVYIKLKIFKFWNHYFQVNLYVYGCKICYMIMEDVEKKLMCVCNFNLYVCNFYTSKDFKTGIQYL